MAIRSGRIALAGRPNAGKSSLLNALVGERLALVSSKPQSTRLPVVGIRTDTDVQYVFHDLPGFLDPGYPMQERMASLAREGLERVDVILHLHPASEAPAPPLVSEARLDLPPAAPIVLVYTKADLVSESAKRSLARDASVVSALTGDGLDSLLEAIRQYLPERPFAYPADDLGTQPTRFFVTEFLREAAFEHLEEELPYAIAAEVEEFREESEPVYIRATIFVERDSQKPIVIGSGGRTIKRLGEHARRRLEELLGQRVFLDTRVKVLPRWRRSAAQLARFGFPDPETGGKP